MWHSQGKITVTTSGTPVRVTSTHTGCQTAFFQQVESNTGKLWICDRSSAVTSTGVGVLATIPAPTLSGGVAVVLPYVAITIPTAPGGIDLQGFWIDADEDGDACQVSCVRP